MIKKIFQTIRVMVNKITGFNKILESQQKQAAEIERYKEVLKNYRDENVRAQEVINSLLKRADQSELKITSLQPRVDSIELGSSHLQPRVDLLELGSSHLQPRVDSLEMALNNLLPRVDKTELKLHDLPMRVDDLEIINQQWIVEKEELARDLTLQVHYQCQSLQQRIDQYIFDLEIKSKNEDLKHISNE